MFRNIHFLLFFVVILQSCHLPKDKEIEVTLFSSIHSITSKVDIKKTDSGQKHIRVLLTNNGDKIDRLDSINVVISPPEKVSNSTKLVFGGTCMGRTPINQTITTDNTGKSGTYQMLKINEVKFSPTGILTWNTFLPYI